MASVRSRGWTIDYSVAGEGPPLLLVVGLSQWASQWSELGYVDALRDGFRVLTADVLGHGNSDKPHESSAYDPCGLVSDLLAVLDQEEIDSVTAWGFSFGVQHVTDLALVAPSRVRSLVCGGGDLRGSPDEVLANVTRLAALLRAPGGMETMWESVGYVGEEAVAVGLAHNDLEALACWCEARPLWRPAVNALAMPTLAYWGTEEDEPTLLRKLLGSSLESFTVPQADHFGAFARPDEVLPCVRPFLERTATAAATA
jgi:pimeloyl-ACP methyl ester carboxylesterase